jgi:hypothetical protein
MAKSETPGGKANKGDYDTCSIDTPQPNTNWTDGSSKWAAYGFEDPTPPNGRTAWVNDLNGNKLVDGQSISPIQHNPPYQWGFKFQNLQTGQTVVLYVQWTFPDAKTFIKSVQCTVSP